MKTTRVKGDRADISRDQLEGIDGSRLVVVAGLFGSGKTETAINYSLWFAEKGEPVTLVDLDVVTTYLRTREVRESLTEKGVRVVTPSPEGDLDLPAITAEMWGVMEKPDGRVVVDLGGSAPGARAMGQFSLTLRRAGYSMYLVLNPYRPFTTDVEGMVGARKEIVDSSRLEISALVSNPHLMGETTLEVVEKGHLLVEEAARRMGLPIAFLCLAAGLMKEGLEERFGLPILPMRRYMLAPWEA
jgi:hypothetical protein